jgi:hypothetical protein
LQKVGGVAVLLRLDFLTKPQLVHKQLNLLITREASMSHQMKSLTCDAARI